MQAVELIWHCWKLALILAPNLCLHCTTLVMMRQPATLLRVLYLLSLSWSASSTFVTFLCVGIPQLHPCMHIHMLARTHASMQAQTHAQPHVLHAAIQRPCMLGMPWVHVPWHARARTHTNPPRPPASPPHTHLPILARALSPVQIYCESTAFCYAYTKANAVA